MTLQQFAAFLNCAMIGAFDPYSYTPIFRWINPQHLVTRGKEREEFLEALRTQKPGEALKGNALKVFKKDIQLAEERKVSSGHLLFTEDKKHWHLFYFNHKDIKRHSNHWEQGPHIHYISSLWPNISFDQVVETISKAGKDFPKPLHIRYEHKIESTGVQTN